MGPDGVSEQNAPEARRRASDHRQQQQQHIIRYHRQTGNETNGERTARAGRQSSYRATESGARERKGNGLHARSPPGAHDHSAERPSSRSKAGGWALAARYWARHCRIAECCQSNAGPLCLPYRTANHALRSRLIRRCERGTPRTSIEGILSDRRRQRRQPALTGVCVCAGARHD